ncbi:MAG: hypothetical protein RL095_3114 [Verrucomicrobiota bacterium]|jgi:predicted LPLAT superfamily acyltransferase
MEKSSTKAAWLAQKERGSLWGIRFLAWVLRHAGERVCRLVMIFPVAWFCLFPGKAGLASALFLKRARAAGAPVPRLFPVCRHFWDFSCSLLEKFAYWTGSRDTGRVDFPARGELAAAVAAGQGGLIVGAHYGNLEGMRALSGSIPGLRMIVFIEYGHAAKYSAILRQSGAAEPGHCRLVSSAEVNPALASELLEHVQSGGYIILLADRAAPGGGGGRIREKFLGGEIELPDGPWRLAQLLRCPVWTSFCRRQAGRHQVQLERLCGPVARRDGGVAAAEARRLWLQRLEKLVLEDPLQWYNFYDFWNETGSS